MHPIFETIHTPTLLLNPVRAKANIETMAAKARQSGVRFRPHFKTHQSARIGEWFRAQGVEAITVSSVTMAAYFARHGWRDITIAFPVNLRELEAINRLAAQVRLGLLVESPESAAFLAQHLTAPVDVWLKVDTGYGRTGLLWSDHARLETLAGQVAAAAPRLRLRGLLTHAGHAYREPGPARLEAVYRHTAECLQAARAALAGVGPLEISVGDTPGCSAAAHLGGVDEIRPGNFVFYDLMQAQLGACTEHDIAVAVACPVVAKHPAQGKLVIYGGAVHHSKEFIVDAQGRQLFGRVALPTADGWGPALPGAYLAGVTQEHGLILADDDTLNRVQVGDLVIILPVHSCLTVDLMGQYLTLAGEIIKVAG